MKTLYIALGLPVLFACGGGDVEPCNNAVGNICTIAGNGENGYFGDGGNALEARMSLPQDVLVADDGTVYVLDWNNHRIRKITADGKMEHVAGRGELGGTLDDPANSDFNHPTGMIFNADKSKLLIAAWHNSKIREINLATLEISDACGDGRRAYFGDEGAAKMATLDLPASLALSPSGDLIVMDQANQVMRRIDSAGVIHRFAGQCVIDRPMPEGPGTCDAPVACPSGSGKLTCGGLMMTCGQPCNPGYAGDEGPALDIRMSQPFGQSADPAGRIAYHDDELYFADTTNALIRKIDANGMVRRVAGVAPIDGMRQRGYSGDGGPALEAKLNNPVDLVFDGDGTLYFTDVYNHCVRAIDSSGVIRTVAGKCGTAGTTGDSGPATDALLKRPYGLDLADGTLYIADTGNNRVRAVRLR
jgi:DNA-binding beta-propeller fold protein YncE